MELYKESEIRYEKHKLFYNLTEEESAAFYENLDYEYKVTFHKRDGSEIYAYIDDHSRSHYMLTSSKPALFLLEKFLKLYLYASYNSNYFVEINSLTHSKANLVIEYKDRFYAYVG